MKKGFAIRFGAALFCAVALMFVYQAATKTSSAAAQPATIALVAYSTPREAYQEIINAFTQTKAGNGVQFTQSYGGSGEQSRAVEAGLDADVVAFSLEPDITRLVKAGIVAPDWGRTRYHGMVTDSVVVFIVRKGNPKNIKSWDDLIKRDVSVITPNPFTSGGARWNVIAAYDAQLRNGRTQKQAEEYLRELFSHVAVQDKSAREALQTFMGGKGDVMLAYESEALAALRHEASLDYLIPQQTILIENPIAVTKSSHFPAQAQAFVEFTQSPTGQAIFAKYGYRAVDQHVLRAQHFSNPKILFTIADLGGWQAVQKNFFDKETGLVTKIESGLGLGVGQ